MNGSVSSFKNFAYVKQGFDNDQATVELQSTGRSSPGPFTLDQKGLGKNEARLDDAVYPVPAVGSNPSNQAGYYLTGPEYEDVAVLSLLSFENDFEDEDFSREERLRFLKQSKAAGKTKLIIDLSMNGGGYLAHAFDLFMALFPESTPNGAHRFRAHQMAAELGWEATHVTDAWSATEAAFDRENLHVFNYRLDLNEKLKAFESWRDKFGPHQMHNDNFSSVIRYNLSDTTVFGLNVTGYGEAEGAVTEQLFKSRDIVMVLNGFCASTCALFVEMMRQQGGVTTVVLGGQGAKRPMQAVGGTKGAQVMFWAQLYEIAQMAKEYTSPERQRKWGQSALGRMSDFALARAMPRHARVNFKDALRDGDKSQTPLQFITEPADCRMFYTADMVKDVTAMWKAVADTTWRGQQRCIAPSSS